MFDLQNKLIYIEYFGQVNFYIGLGLKVVSAIILGLIIGLDREKKMKSAGIKTQIMICVGATIYTALGLLNMQMYRIGDNIDPNRLGAQIVSGIGFLGAGAIMQSQGTVKGMTTAATIWVVAAIGMAIGSGYIFSALFFTLTIIIILNLIEPILSLLGRDQTFSLEIQGQPRMIKSILKEIDDSSVEIIDTELFNSSEDDQKCNYHLEVTSSSRALKKFLQFLRAHKRVDSFTHHRLRKK